MGEEQQDEKLLTSQEAADFLSVSTRTLQRLVTPRGPIRTVRFGQVLRFRRQDLREFVASHVA